jgi:hypothetical protein
MKWFKKKKDIEYEIISKDIPLTHLMRWFLYDTGLIDPNEIVNRLNLTPVSDEGDIKEEEDSDIRMANIAELIPFLELMSDITADAIVAIQIQDIEESLGPDAEQIVHEMTVMSSLYKVVGLSALVSAFSAAAELGMISTDAVQNMRLEAGNFDEQ